MNPEQVVLIVLLVIVSGSIASENVMIKFALVETLTAPVAGLEGFVPAAVGATVSGKV